MRLPDAESYIDGAQPQVSGRKAPGLSDVIPALVPPPDCELRLSRHGNRWSAP